MVFNVRRFSTAQFPAEFLDVSGTATIPTSATLVITYGSTSGVIGSTTIAMVVTGNVFIGTWGAGNADLGLWGYSISAPGLPAPVTGNIRVLSSV